MNKLLYRVLAPRCCDIGRRLHLKWADHEVRCDQGWSISLSRYCNTAHTARLPSLFLRVYPPQWPEQSARQGRFTSPSMIEVTDAHARGTARNV